MRLAERDEDETLREWERRLEAVVLLAVVLVVLAIVVRSVETGLMLLSTERRSVAVTLSVGGAVEVEVEEEVSALAESAEFESAILPVFVFFVGQ